MNNGENMNYLDRVRNRIDNGTITRTFPEGYLEYSVGNGDLVVDCLNTYFKGYLVPLSRAEHKLIFDKIEAKYEAIVATNKENALKEL